MAKCNFCNYIVLLVASCIFCVLFIVSLVLIFVVIPNLIDEQVKQVIYLKIVKNVQPLILVPFA